MTQACGCPYHSFQDIRQAAQKLGQPVRVVRNKVTGEVDVYVNGQHRQWIAFLPTECTGTLPLSMIRFSLSAESQAEPKKRVPRPRESFFQGVCSKCGADIPHGTLMWVKGWVSKQDNAGRAVQVPKETFCKACSKTIEAPKRSYVKRAVAAPVDTKLAVKEIAVALYKACSKVPHSSRKLAELAGIEYTELILPVLKKLREVGKVEFVEGRWRRI
jgi:hypothetical protein